MDRRTRRRRRAPERSELIAQTDRLQTLNEISRVVSSALDLPRLYDTIYQQIGRVMDTSHFFIALRRREQASSSGPNAGVLDVPYLQEEGTLFLDEVIPFGDNVTSLIVQHGTTLLYHNATEYAAYEQAQGATPLIVGDKDSESGIFVPLNTGSRTIGALSVQSPRPNAYTEDDVQTLAVIASQAAVAIENARLYKESQDAMGQMEALLHVAQMINGSLDIQTVLDSILTGMRDVLPYYTAAVLLPNPAAGRLELVGSAGPNAEERRRTAKIPIGQGVTGRVFASGEPLIVPDVGAFEGFISIPSIKVGSEMAVPLKQGHVAGGTEVIGVLNVTRTERNAFSEHDLSLLILFASQAAIAIENAGLCMEQQRRFFELQTIQSIVQQITPLHQIEAIAQSIKRELKRLIDYHACRMFALDQRSQALIPVAVDGAGTAAFHPRLGEGITGWIGLHGESVIIPNTLDDPRTTQIAGTPKRVESLIGAPLIYEGRVRGVITLSKLGADEFDVNDLRLLEILAGQAAIAFDRARLYEELRTQALTDDLTKLYNRRHLLDRFQVERSRAMRNKYPLAAIMLDIDKFKRVNDTYGHDAGDVVLQELAALVRKVVRAEDIVARYGGEEFCVLLPEISTVEAERVAERLRSIIERRRLPEAAGARHVTVSVGLAFLDPRDEDAELFTRADLAMYQVKGRDGNFVCIHDGPAFYWYGHDHVRLLAGER